MTGGHLEGSLAAPAAAASSIAEFATETLVETRAEQEHLDEEVENIEDVWIEEGDGEEDDGEEEVERWDDDE